jgi:hypothetical protein
MKPVLAVLGIGMMILGFFGLSRVAWLGWLEIVMGVLALAAASARAPRVSQLGGAVLGVATLLLWIIALASGVVGWLTWLTFIFGIAFILASPVMRPLPPGRGPTTPTTLR